jgi:ArsR family transcriptional regulator
MLSSDRAQLARWFHALSDETRLEILSALTQGETCVCDLTEVLGAAQSRLSFHLKVLKTAGFVTDRREGRWSYYALCPEVLDQVGEALKELAPGVDLSSHSARCCD